MKTQHKSLLLKRKAVSGVTLLDSDFALKQNTKLPTNTTNKFKKKIHANKPRQLLTSNNQHAMNFGPARSVRMLFFLHPN
jgi:hypothetical protein